MTIIMKRYKKKKMYYNTQTRATKLKNNEKKLDQNKTSTNQYSIYLKRHCLDIKSVFYCSA